MEFIIFLLKMGIFFLIRYCSERIYLSIDICMKKIKERLNSSLVGIFQVSFHFAQFPLHILCKVKRSLSDSQLVYKDTVTYGIHLKFDT